MLTRGAATRRFDAAYAAAAPPVLPSHLAHERYLRLKRRVATAAALLVVMSSAVAVWLWAPHPVLAAVLPWTAPAPTPVIPTAASFTITGRGAIASPLAGPFLSLDEAEAAQRRLRAQGFGATRVHVDERLRHVTNAAAAASRAPAVVLTSSPSGVSLVIELNEAPTLVNVERDSRTALHVDVGPIGDSVATQRWIAPANADMVQEIRVEQLPTPGAKRVLRVRVTLPETAIATPRVEGRRVYLDFSWRPAAAPRSAPRAIRQSRPVPASPSAPASASTVAAAPRPAADALAPVLTRLQQLTPFLTSAAASPSPDVLAAINGPLNEVEALLETAAAHRGTAAHDLLSAALGRTRQAMRTESSGDRVTLVNQAAEMIKAAAAELAGSH